MALRRAAIRTAVPFVMAATAVLAGGSATDNARGGGYSPGERPGVSPRPTGSEFRQIDTDGNGTVSPAEFRRGQDNGHLREPIAAE